MPDVLTYTGQESTLWLSIADYAEAHGLGYRTVQRYIADGKLPSAEKSPDGKWRIPADAVPLVVAANTPQVVKTTPTDVRQAYEPRPPAAPLGMLGTIDEAAQALGTTVGGVRRLAQDGHLIIGRYGPRGSLRVYLPPAR